MENGNFEREDSRLVRVLYFISRFDAARSVISSVPYFTDGASKQNHCRHVCATIISRPVFPLTIRCVARDEIRPLKSNEMNLIIAKIAMRVGYGQKWLIAELNYPFLVSVAIIIVDETKP